MGNTYYIIRHGQTVWNTLGKTQGHGNSDLTESGVAQAKDLAESLADEGIDFIYSSNLGRAVQTAKAIGDRIGKKVIPTEYLREMGFGVWEGKLIPEIEAEYGDMFKTWRNEPHKVDIIEGENLHIVKERVDAFIDALNKKYDNKKIVLVTHSMTARVMLLSFLNSGMENIYRIRQSNTALNVVKFESYGPVIIKMNDTTHIKTKSVVLNSALE
ncbi:MAG: histidine phosphatase family protein [Clostridioides sp.]|jgi:probable phosphoglycerate mutase|nr:histidine phosphatase family protein [Clostridioides sp.]